MININDIINNFCPSNVEYKELGQLGTFLGGITGKSKSDFENGNSKFITYKNVYSNPALDLDVSDTVLIGENENQRTLAYGDIIFTGSSETPEECGISSVLTEKTDEKLYLNSFCFVFRFNDPDIMSPNFAKHLFRSTELRKQIIRTASGVTRYNVSKKLMKKVVIPILPLDIQDLIAEQLDKLLTAETTLEQALVQELDLRNRQRDLVKNQLLDFSNRDDVPVKKLGIVCTVQAGGTPAKSKKEYWSNGTIKWLSSTVCKNKMNVEEVTDYITEEGLAHSSAKLMKPGTTLIALVGATIGKLSFLNFEAAINQNVAGVYPNDLNEILPEYVFFICGTLYNQFINLNNGKLAMANMSFVRGLEIPVPSIDEQRMIVKKIKAVDYSFDEIINLLTSDLDLTKKQYKYYSDYLLNYKKEGK